MEKSETDTEHDRKLEKEKCLAVLYELLKEEKRLDEKFVQLSQVASNRETIMHALHEYNDIKDATQIVLGHLADFQGITVRELHEKFHLPTNDD